MNIMRTALALLIPSLLAAQDVERPKITGMAHIALFVKDIEKSRAFYTGWLGYEEAFDLKNPDGSLSLTFVKVNEKQYIELFPEREPNSDRLNHISIETDNADQMRRYLASKGVKTPDTTPKGRIKNSNFNVKDADGHTVEIVQYEPDGWTIRDKGKALGPNRVSTEIMHLGIIAGSLSKAIGFYQGVLGFSETWRGSRDGKTLNWTNMKVPDGDTYVELMLYDKLPEPTKRGTQHHICLSVPDIEAAVKKLEARPYYKTYTRGPLEIRTGVNRKRQCNLYDPDGTRIELMEPFTDDRKPTPSATAAPPIP